MACHTPIITFKRETALLTGPMNVEHAIRTISLFADYRFIRRYKYWNGDTNRSETCYVFSDQGKVVTYDCLRELRIQAKKLEALWT